MKHLLLVKIDGKFLYVIAERFLARSKILSAESSTEQPIDTINLTYALTELKDGKVTTNHFGYVSDVAPGRYLLWTKDEHKKSYHTGPKIVYFNSQDIEIIEQIYNFF